MNSTVDCFPPPSPIQRVLLLHLNLHEVCMGGESLGEGASMEEISEQILYYHRDRRIGITLAEDEEGNLTLGMGSLMEEAVQFLGLCIALYTLPSSLNISKSTGRGGGGGEEEDTIENKDRSNSIYFGNSTLVFIPLESSLNIVAVAQISRLYQNGSKNDSGSGNPSAIRTSIERTHQLFCMLRGGGILYRLKATPCEKNSRTNNSCAYKGMDQLFPLLKDIRKCKEKLSKLDSSDDCYEETNKHLHALEQEVRLLRKTLPIQSIRRDLDAHYKEYLSDFSLVISRNGGAGRCLVEMMPIPIAQDSGSHTYQVPPSLTSSQSVESLAKSTRQALRNHCKSNNDKKNLSLLGITAYDSGQLLYSQTDSEDYSLSNVSVSLLMAYMASYRTKMNHISTLRHNTSKSMTSGSSSSSSEQQLGLKRLTLSFRPLTDEPPNGTALQNGTVDTSKAMKLDFHRRGRFVSSPPLFMLSASYQNYCLDYGDSKQNIWAPRVHIPLKFSTTENLDEKEGNDQIIIRDCHVVLFEYLQFSFLLVLDLSLTTNASPEDLSEARLLLMKLEEELSEAVLLALNVDPNDGTIPRTESVNLMEWMNGPGQDIVLLERTQHKLIIFLDPRQPSSSSYRRDPKKKAINRMEKSQNQRFLGFGSRKKDFVPSQSPNHESKTLEWSALGLDCRHLLASRLPLDVCLAFDDMMNEFSRRKDPRQKASNDSNDSSTPFTLELCTCMPPGWIYAFVHGDKEIYAFFDITIYVTVADVQAAAFRIQETFILTS